MFTVHKYPFTIQDEILILMPEGAEVLLVECQSYVPCIWVKVKVKSDKSVERRFFITGTGHPTVKPSYKHVASFQQTPYVWHIWEE